MAKQNEVAEFSTQAVDKTTAFIEKNKKILIGVIAAIVIIALGSYLYYEKVYLPKEETASTLLAKGQNYFMQGNYDVALKGNKGDFAGFLALIDQYGSTKAGNLAKLYTGLCYAQTGNTKKAITYLEKFSKKGDTMVSPAAIAALGNCYAQEGQTDKAISLLKEAAEKSNSNSLSPTFLIQAAELLESQNNTDEALKIYKEIKAKYTEGTISEVIDKYIEKLNK